MIGRAFLRPLLFPYKYSSRNLNGYLLGRVCLRLLLFPTRLILQRLNFLLISPNSYHIMFNVKIEVETIRRTSNERESTNSPFLSRLL